MAAFDQHAQHVDTQTNVVYQSTSADLSARQRQDRARMLARMRGEVEEWARGALDGALQLTLDLEYRAEVAPDRWSSVVQERGRARPTPLAARTVVDAFDLAAGELLVLGAPGAGKTTTLLDLTRDLIRRAEDDETLPMPIVLHLASWGAKRGPLTTWLVEELRARYDVPVRIARRWVEREHILPILDGLDEVAAEHRVACVAAINAFRDDRAQHLASLVVGCRVADYEPLPRLHLQGTVVIRPLEDVQIERCLLGAGDEMTGLRIALREDDALRELATTPLFLGLMVLTYRGISAEAVRSHGTVADRRTELLTAYVVRMFVRRTRDTRYSCEQTLRWLAWVARALIRQRQDALYLESLQPDWLPTAATRRHYAVVDRLGGGLLGSLMLGLGYWSIGGLTDSVAYQVGYGVIGGLLGGLAFGLFGGRDEAVVGARRSVRVLVRDVALGLTVGPSIGLTVGLMGWFVSGEPFAAIVGLLVGLVFGMPLVFLSGLAGGPGIGPRRITVVETIGWSPLKAIRLGLLGGLFSGVPVGLIFGLADGRLTSALDGVLRFGGSSGLTFGLLGGLTGGQVVVRARPGQGIQRSFRQAITVGLYFGLVGGLVGGLASGLTRGPTDALIDGLPLGLAFGLVGGLAYGGQAYLSHVALRVVLWQLGALPLRCARFLDYATERIFLRRVGGGYTFVHRLVQDHIATHEDALVLSVSRSRVDAGHA